MFEVGIYDSSMQQDDHEASLAPERGVFCNRTLNLRKVKAIGYDMDYTLLHYRIDVWETAAFEHARSALATQGWPVKDLKFDPDAYIQGLTFDLELGNLVKPTRFGYVITAHHGTSKLSFEDQKLAYAETFVNLAEPRWRFVNTLFSLSEAALFAQLVDKFDAGELSGVNGYEDLYRHITRALDVAHSGGALKAEIVSDPDRFLEVDPDVVETLLDQRSAGKKLLLITNSEWPYTQAMMSHAFDRFVPSGSWRKLFDLVVVAASKPRFFESEGPVYRVVSLKKGTLLPHSTKLEANAVYHGGSAHLVERSLGLSGDEILYVGDHLFGDVHVLKSTLRWRTALILREIESELKDAAELEEVEAQLHVLMKKKISYEDEVAELRLIRARQVDKRDVIGAKGKVTASTIETVARKLRAVDKKCGPLVRELGSQGNETWGPLMRAGSDKSLFARQVERHADIYTSRVANLKTTTPYAFIRAARTSLPHDLLTNGNSGDGNSG